MKCLEGKKTDKKVIKRSVVQNSSGKQEDDKKRNMEKVAKGNKTIQKMRRHDMMNQK